MKKTVHSKFLFLLISFMILALFASCAPRATIRKTLEHVVVCCHYRHKDTGQQCHHSQQ